MLRVEILWQDTVLHQELYIKSQPDRKKRPQQKKIDLTEMKACSNIDQ